MANTTELHPKVRQTCLFSKMCFIFNESSGWNSIHLFMFGNISLHWYAWNIKKKNIFFQTVFSGENVLSIEKQLPEEVSHKSRNLAITLGWCHPCYNTQSMLCVANTFASKSYNNRNFYTDLFNTVHCTWIHVWYTPKIAKYAK